MKNNIFKLLTINELNYKIKEDVDIGGFNSPKAIKQRELTRVINEFNSKKNAFSNIFKKQATEWEKDAALVIKDNPYLGIQWEIEKLEFKLETLKNNMLKMQGDDLTNAQKELANITKQLQDSNKKLQDRMKKDKADILTLL